MLKFSISLHCSVLHFSSCKTLIIYIMLYLHSERTVNSRIPSQLYTVYSFSVSSSCFRATSVNRLCPPAAEQQTADRLSQRAAGEQSWWRLIPTQS